MAALKKLDEVGNEPFSNRYGGVPVIYVESQEDEYIFESWFKHYLGKLEIKPADRCCDAGGCNAVIEKVLQERASQNAAWGVVDRDTVMKDDRWNLVWETNDIAFDDAKPFGQFIKVLRRWEIENYLIDADSLEEFRAAERKLPQKSQDDVWQELHGHCDAFLPVQAYNAMCHEHRVKGISDGFGVQLPGRREVMAELQSKKLAAHPQAKQAIFLANLPRVEAFDLPEADYRARTESLMRIIPGKAVFIRFIHSSKIKHQIEGHIIQKMGEKSRIPREISDFVEMILS